MPNTKYNDPVHVARRQYQKRWLSLHPGVNASLCKAYRESHKEELAVSKAAYYAANREKSLEAQRAWRESHHEDKLAKDRAYKEANRERCRKNSRNWALANPDKYRANMRAAQHKRRPSVVAGCVTGEQWLELLGASGGKCAKCGAEERLEMDHVIPLSSGGEHNIGNIQVLCRSCNAQKWTRTEDWRT